MAYDSSGGESFVDRLLGVGWICGVGCVKFTIEKELLPKAPILVVM